MVISIIIEGGVLAHENVSALTMDNVEALRQSLHRIFYQILSNNENLSIRIIPQAGKKQAIKNFLSTDEGVYLLVDLDMPKAKISSWCNNLATSTNNPITIPANKSSNIFFMIQEMEAWILKQPESIYNWAAENNYICKKNDILLREHTLLKGRDVENITKPSKVLEKLISIFFLKANTGRSRTEQKKGGKIRYSKLKEGAELLDCLDVGLLLSQDTELQRFQQILDSLSEL